MTPATLARLHAATFVSPRPWTEVEFADALARADTFILTEAEGFLIGRVVADEAELLTLAVPAALRRRGLGAGLVAGFEVEAARRGAARAFLEVAADNVAAVALYRSAGWEEAGRRKGYFRRPGGAADALVMRRDLVAG